MKQPVLSPDRRALRCTATTALARDGHTHAALRWPIPLCALSWTLLAVCLSSPSLAGITFTPFGSNGEGGTINGQSLSFGSGGEVYELDAFLGITGQDLNGVGVGTTAQLSRNPLPAGVSFVFGKSLSPDGSDLTLTYTFTNNTASTLPGTWFGVFVDPQIDVALNGYQNEAGIQFGTTGTGHGGTSADQFQIDEPGYVSGNIFTHLLQGSLDGTNSVPDTAPNDVSVAHGFSLGDLSAGATATISVMLSDSGDSLGTLALQTYDTDPQSFDALTVSGTAQVLAVPEPSGLLLGLIACGSFATLFMFRRVPRPANASFQDWIR